MKKLVIIALFLAGIGLAADTPDFPDLPDSPVKLIETLKSADKFYTIRTHRLDYVKDSDIPHLVGLLDSKEPCAHVVLSDSSILPPGRSTVGHEAAYLIEGFWKRYYPTQLVSSQYAPDIEGMKHWYAMWSNMRKLAEPSAQQKDVPKKVAATHASLVAYPNAVICLKDPKTELVFYVESNGCRLVALDKDGSLAWSVDVLAEAKFKPTQGEPVIRHLRLQDGELRVTCGKHDFAKVQLKTGKTEYVGAD